METSAGGSGSIGTGSMRSGGGKDADRHRLRTTFDDSPEIYDRSRPVAPPQVFDDLVVLARLAPGARLLEIGCGTGQATVPLAERGFAIVGVELGANLADFARRRLAPFPRVRIVTSSFEQWDPAGERFGGVVSSNAFHWIDPEVRYAKSAAVLEDGGALTVLEMRFATPDDADPTWVELQEDYDAVVGPAARNDRPPHPDAVKDRAEEYVVSGHFRDVSVRRYQWSMSFGADEYLALLSTSSWHKRLDEDVRLALFERIHRRIQAQPDGQVTPTLLALLHVAERV
jgi:SAM-dependent methyltransferase